jgi:geranylgeranyl pyrophosphate synthase
VSGIIPAVMTGRAMGNLPVVYARKTASLFEASARMGAMLAGGNEEIVNALADYAYNLGLTFQIVDDILDIIGDPETLGKPVGTDLAQNRGVMMVKNGGVPEQAETVTAVAEAEDDPVARMLENLRNSGAVEIARMQAQEVAERARQALKIVPPSEAKTELEEIIELVLNRDK